MTGRTTEKAMGLALPELFPNLMCFLFKGHLQLQIFLVFCPALCKIAGKNAKINQNQNQVYGNVQHRRPNKQIDDDQRNTNRQ